MNIDGVQLPNKALTNVDLENACRQLNIPIRGVFMRDSLPKRCKEEEFGIVNLDSRFGEGTHWVCYGKRGDEKLYFDSFGLLPPLELQRYLGKRVFYSSYQIQRPEDVICGHLCLLILNRIKDNLDVENFENILQRLY